MCITVVLYEKGNFLFFFQNTDIPGHNIFSATLVCSKVHSSDVMQSYQQAQKNIIANTQRWVLHSKTLSISIKYVECCNQIHISANSWLAHSEFQGLEQPPPPWNPPPPNLCFSLRELNGQGLCKPVIYYSTFFSIVVSSTSQILRFLKTWNLTASQIECFFVWIDMHFTSYCVRRITFFCKLSYHVKLFGCSRFWKVPCKLAPLFGTDSSHVSQIWSFEEIGIGQYITQYIAWLQRYCQMRCVITVQKLPSPSAQHRPWLSLMCSSNLYQSLQSTEYRSTEFSVFV